MGRFGVLRRAWGVWVFLLGMLCASGVAQAQSSSKTFRFESDSDDKIELVLYSQDRQGYQWPGSGRVYVLDDDETRNIKISCLGGEKVCYGAWVAGNKRRYWGSGYNNQQRCTRCCYTCDGGTTPVITLE